MTIEEMRQSKKVWLSPQDVRDVLHVAPYGLNVMAKQQGPQALPFECFFIGSRLKIPRVAFLEWCERTRIN